MISLRPYQREAVDSLFGYFETSKGNPILSLPTGSGKSIIQAAFVTETLARWPGERFLLVSHVKELLAQNHAKLEALGVEAGIYSAGLKRRDVRQVTVAGIQSVYKRAHELGDVSIVIVDECHLLSKKSDSMYQSFLSDLRRYCPHVKVVGMSATPFRLDSGPLHRGDKSLFSDIAYHVSIKELIEQGYLSPLVTARTRARADTSGVRKQGGEFVAGDLERCLDKDALTAAALDEVEALASDRKAWLVFCSGVDHAAHVAEAIRARGHTAEVVVGSTPAAEREAHLSAFKRGEIRALVSVGVLTTGFDAPNADALICLRPTCSPGLWVQMVGRITRLHTGKTDGMVLDFTTNTTTHGPIDLIEIDGSGNVKEAPCRVCPSCGGLAMPGAKACPDCGYVFCRTCPKCQGQVTLGLESCPDCGFVFAIGRVVRHETTVSEGEILSSSSAPAPVEVDSWTWTPHHKTDKPPSVRVRYWCGLAHYDEWVCLDHGGYARTKAERWWVRHGGRCPIPSTAEAIARIGECERPKAIRVRREGKYWRVV